MAEWFGGEGDNQFVQAMRMRFASDAPQGTQPGSTSFTRFPAGPVLEIELPGLTVPCRLHVGYFTSDGRANLQCEWSFTEYVLDGGPWKNPSPIATGDVDHDAFAAFGWLTRELDRPLVERRWTKLFDVNAREWSLADPIEVVRRTGVSLRRFRHRAPDVTVRLR